ncbi:sugar ABC transporter permease [Levilinea saccharolytica]|uniref:Xylose transport system permease protein XylH n=1 Tax=Levilinea saccharolytica TaxID=229921 RepID=A0A0P6XAK2_9CHLR|nr:sugar ABC transporter permease [Levilinea saccharolytica]KPL79780.1 D-xylose ABC transporter permease [Levilinea saccharolytica]
METLSKRVRQNIQTYTIILALVGIWILFTVLTKGAFMTPQNFSNLFRQMTVTSFLAIGMVLVIVTGGIDLSVGKAAGFVSVICAFLQARFWVDSIPISNPYLMAAASVLVGLIVGTAWGAAQGALIAYLRIPPFIATLGGLFIARGLILWRTEGKTIPANQVGFSYIAQGYLSDWIGWVLAALVVIFLFFNMFSSRSRKVRYGVELPPIAFDLLTTSFFALLVVVYVFMVNRYNGVQVPVALLAVASVIMTYVSNNTRFGRYTYAIGGNREAARLSGIDIKKTLFLVYTLMGFLVGVGGVVLASYVGYGTIAAGEGYELDAIASAILGGTSTLGGVGTVFGALIGALIMSSLSTGLQMMNVAPFVQYLVKGMVLVLAVLLDVSFKKGKA